MDVRRNALCCTVYLCYSLDCYVNAAFTPAVFKFLLGHRSEIDDLEHDDPSLFRFGEWVNSVWV